MKASLAMVALLGLAGAAQASGLAYDLIIRGGTILDGRGGAPYAADVGIIGGYVAGVRDLGSATAKAEIDARGKYVSPGFINIHSHAEPDAVATAANMLFQGVTTELINSDGGMRGPAKDIRAGIAEFTRNGLALNLAPYIGFNAVWGQVVGLSERRPTDAEMLTMKSHVLAGMRDGAWGVSAGLDYKPGYYATTQEVIDIITPAAPWRTNFTNHERVGPPEWSSLKGIAETIEIGQKSGLVPIVTHMKIWAQERGKVEAALDLIRASVASGRYAAADTYPYTISYSGAAGLLMPAWAVDGGREKMLQRFKDPALRKRIAAGIEEALDARVEGAKGLYFPELKLWLPQVMAQMNTSAGETVIRLLEKSDIRSMFQFGTEPELEAILKFSNTSMACDCGASLNKALHPRAHGSFARVLGRYVRERGTLSWPEAIRKMTLLPAATIGMIDRGMLAPGMVADVVVFDPARIADKADLDDPAQLSTGVTDVIIAGTVVIRNETLTAVQSGKILLRSPDMPTRAMKLASDGSLSLRDVQLKSVASDAVTASLRLRISYSGKAHSPGGELMLKAGRQEIRASSFSAVQTAPDWLGFSAWADAGNGPGVPLLVTIDRGSPLAKGRSIVTIRTPTDTWRGEAPGASPTLK